MCQESGRIVGLVFQLRRRYSRIQSLRDETHAGVQAALRAVGQAQRAVYLADKLRGDRQSQTGAAGIAIARVLQAKKGLQHRLQRRLRDPRPLIQHMDSDIPGGVAGQGYRYRGAEFQPVIDKAAALRAAQQSQLQWSQL